MSDQTPRLPADLTPEECEEFRDWIHHHSGIYLEESKADSLRIALLARATRLALPSYSAYFDVLKSDEDEFKELMNVVTINETSFFRFPAQFDALRDHVIPEIAPTAEKADRPLRVWSAGCSTGEEPYSIAMALLESCAADLGGGPSVLGTDVSTQALDRARAAVYPAKGLAGLPQHTVQRWFEPVAGGHRPVEQVRECVDFAFHNLVREPYPATLLGEWDVVFCRNVTIYFRLESTRRVVQHFYDSLVPGGYLFIGHSETLTTVSDRFETREIDGVFVYRKPARVPSFVVPPGVGVASRRGADAAATRGRSGVVDPASAARARRTTPPASQPTPASEGAPSRAEAVAELVEAARASLAADDTRAARASADRALVLDPRDADALLVRAYANAELGDLDAAISDAESALSTDPLLAAARYILGIIYLRRSDPERAVSEFKRTLYIDQDFVLAHFNLANVRRQQGEMDDACREYENTIRSLYQNPTGSWTLFMGGFKPDVLIKSCERSLVECRKGASRP
jgi:chemotaxis protein methyltransferase CheR